MSTAFEQLPEKQQRFVEEMLIDPKAGPAYRRAGYYYGTPGSADTMGARLLRNVQVQAALAEKRAERAARQQIAADKVFREWARLAFSDIGQLYDRDGNLKPIHELPEEARALIASVEIEERFEGTGKNRRVVGQTKKVKLWSKTQALDSLAKHLGMLNEPVSPQILQQTIQFIEVRLNASRPVDRELQ
jgi:phage terminase small subunit